MAEKFNNNNHRLTKSEQKTTAAFKLLNQQMKALKLSLKKTQDELEGLRVKYYDLDKDHAVLVSRNGVSVFHEILKYVVSGGIGALGVNYISDGNFGSGSGLVISSLLIYAFIVWTDKK